MCAFRKNRGLVIWDWYFCGRMETISTKKKVNERKGYGNIVQKVCVRTVNEQMKQMLKTLDYKAIYFIVHMFKLLK